MPLSRKSMNPVRRMNGSRRRRAPSASGKPCACFGSGNDVVAMNASGPSTVNPTAASMAGAV